MRSQPGFYDYLDDYEQLPPNSGPVGMPGKDLTRWRAVSYYKQFRETGHPSDRLDLTRNMLLAVSRNVASNPEVDALVDQLIEQLHVTAQRCTGLDHYDRVEHALDTGDTPRELGLDPHFRLQNAGASMCQLFREMPDTPENEHAAASYAWQLYRAAAELDGEEVYFRWRWSTR